MKKLYPLLIVLILVLSGCFGEPKVVVVDEDGNVIEGAEPERVELQKVQKVIVYDEDGSEYTTGNILVDLKTKCKYISYGHSNLASYIDSKGQVDGCKDIKGSEQ